MKNKKDIKNIFIKICRLSVILFLVILAIVVVYTMMTKDEVITFPTVLGVLFLISMIAFLVCLAIAWILDLVESIRRDKVSCLTGYAINIVLLWVAMVAIDYFVGNTDGDWKSSFGRAIIIVCAIKAGSYIFDKDKRK